MKFVSQRRSPPSHNWYVLRFPEQRNHFVILTHVKFKQDEGTNREGYGTMYLHSTDWFWQCMMFYLQKQTLEKEQCDFATLLR